MEFTSQTVEQILLVAKEIVAKVPNCWAVTADLFGGANARVVQPFSSQLDQEGWVVRFLTSARSRKAAEIAKSGRVLLGYQYDPEQASVTLLGAANTIDDRAYLRDQWRLEWNTYFPQGPSDLDAIVVEVIVERIEVLNLVRSIGVPTKGMHAATLRRTPSDDWQPVYE
jgi:general stress protein 26